LKRKDEDLVRSWLTDPHRKPLLVRGARQVGKSTLVRHVARAAGLPLWEVNLEQHGALAAAFESLSPDVILREIGLQLGQSGVGMGPGILFLDEIQAVPRALAALRYFFELRPDIPVVAAGSLLEFSLAESGQSMPVGRVQSHFLGPLSFKEFLGALGEDLLLESLATQGDPARFSLVAHQRLLALVREYLLVGGMPEAVQRYADSRDLAAAIQVHRSIVGTYVDDFGKYVRGADIEKIRRIFEQLPLHLAQKVRYNRYHPDWRAADIRRCLDLLQRAGVAVAAVHSDGNGPPLGAEEDPSTYKLFHLDVGLVGTMTGTQLSLAEFSAGRFINEGVLAEQFVAQELLRAQPADDRPRLHYWQRDGASRNAEVDFLIQRGSSVIPIEVKAGRSGTLRSLHQFMLKHPGQEAIRFDLNPPSVQMIATKVMSGRHQETARYRLHNRPLYLAGVTIDGEGREA
jgi:uncharacterized protein